MRWRYRANGRSVELPSPDTPWFREVYQAAVEGRKIRKAPVVPLPRVIIPATFGDAFKRLQATAKWLSLDPTTKYKNGGLIDEFLKLRVLEDKSTAMAECARQEPAPCSCRRTLGALRINPTQSQAPAGRNPEAGLRRLEGRLDRGRS